MFFFLYIMTLCQVQKFHSVECQDYYYYYYCLERMWKEAVGTYFQVLSQNVSGRTERNHETLKPEPDDTEAEVLTTMQHSVVLINGIVIFFVS
jgi:hypothetical protein